MDLYQKIAITGTKGKTTTARLLDAVLLALEYQTLRVDTDGHYVNAKQKSDYATSMNLWGIVPNVAPGRFLYELEGMPPKKTVAILEAAIGSSSVIGLGYAFHQIGVFTNIYEDHITNRRIKNKRDIYTAKRFVFLKCRPNGTFIFNADDAFLVRQLLKDTIKTHQMAVGRSLAHLPSFFQTKHAWIQIDGSKIYYAHGKSRRFILDTKDSAITYGGVFEPNVYNIGFVVGILIAQLGVTQFFKKIETIRQCIHGYTPDKHGGRLSFIHAQKRTIIVDFAHEKESLKAIAQLGRAKTDKRVIGVIRMDPTRTDTEIQKTAKGIARYYDYLFIYDKVDGVKCTESRTTTGGRKRQIGETAHIFANTFDEMGYQQYTVVLEEENALKDAIHFSEPGDLIIYIGDGKDHKASYELASHLLKR